MAERSKTGEIFGKSLEGLNKFFKKKDRFRKGVCVILGICTAACLTGYILYDRAAFVEAKTKELQKGIAQEVFRFHVLADSDSDEDQAVKLKVRDAVLSYMKESMGNSKEDVSAEKTKRWAGENLDRIEEISNEILSEEGFDYHAEAEVASCYFPEKRYGDVTFPEGEYEALRIRLGEAKGHNWWCVLYPNLCFIDTACAVVSEEGKEELEGVLEDDEYEMITAASDFKIKWFFFGDKTKEK